MVNPNRTILTSTLTLSLMATAAHADRKEDTFYLLLDTASDNAVLDATLQDPLLDMMLDDAADRGLAMADTIILRAPRSDSSWQGEILTTRATPPDQLKADLAQRLEGVNGTEGSNFMRLIQSSRIDCAAAETVTVYLITNLISSVDLDVDTGAHMPTAPSVSWAGCEIVWLGATVGSPDLTLREVQHVDALIERLSTHMGADAYATVR